jgi:uncharacterized membrane protein
MSDCILEMAAFWYIEILVGCLTVVAWLLLLGLSIHRYPLVVGNVFGVLWNFSSYTEKMS